MESSERQNREKTPAVDAKIIKENRSHTCAKRSTAQSPLCESSELGAGPRAAHMHNTETHAANMQTCNICCKTAEKN